MKKTFKNVLIIVTLILSITILTGCGSESSSDGGDSKKNSYTLGETFNFDDLEITLGKDYSFTTIDNEYSENYGADVIKLPITVKNLKEETHGLNMFYYSVFGSKGTEVDAVNTYFDDNIDEAGELRTGASYTKNMYFVYDGDGQYAIEFNDLFNKVTVEFDVTK